MTDPVDTDALRRDARVLSPGFPGVEKRLTAAADEVDRLRISDSNATQQRDQLATALRRSDNENDRLRTVIEDAPHEQSCNLGLPGSYGTPLTCDCWKADAL